MKIELPILFNSKNNIQLEDLGIDTKAGVKDAEVRPVTFYNIECIAPYYEDDQEYCCIHTSEQEYICPLAYRKVKQKIKDTTP